MKLILKLFSILLIVVLIGAGIFLWTFDINQYRTTIADELSALIHRPVSIEAIEMKASFVPTVRLKNLVIGNPEGFKGTEPFLTADSVEGTVALAPLLEKRVQIYDIKIGKVMVNAVDTPQMNNLDFSDVAAGKTGQNSVSSQQTDSGSYLNNLNIDDISALRISVSYQNEVKKYQFVINDLSVQQLRMIKFVLDYDNQIIHFSGNADIMKLIARQDNFVFNSEIEVWGLTGKLSGSIGDMHQFKNMLLNIDMYSDQFSNVLQQAKVPFTLPVSSFTLSAILKGDFSQLIIENFKMSMDNAVEATLKGNISDVLNNLSGTIEGEATLSKSLLTDMYGLKPMSIAVKGSVSAEALNIEKLSVNANRSDADIVMSFLKKGNKYLVNGTVDSNYLDKNDFMVSEEIAGNKPASTPADNENTQEKAEKSILSQLSGQINWNLKNVKLLESSDDYYGFFGRTSFDNDTLSVSPLQIRTIAGLFNGTIKIEKLSSSLPITQLTVSAENVNLDKFKAFADIVTGSTANLSARFNTKGLTQKDILSNLNGTAEVEITEGRVVNKWFNALPETVGLLQKNKSFSYSKTDMESLLNCAVVNVTAKNGILSMDKSVAVETSTLNLLLTGTVNLPAQKMSISILPQLPSVKNSAVLSLAQVIRLEGTFTAPSVRVDSGDVLKEAAKFGFDKLLDKAGLKSQDTQTAVTGSLCETALGHKLKGKVNTSTQTQAPAVTADESSVQPAKAVKKKLSPQEELKNQLIKSISSVIK